MFVVRRAFRGPRGILSAGSVLEPADIKDFRYRLREKHIVEVTEHNFERYKGYFRDRYGVTLQELPVVNAKAEAEAEAEEKAKAEAEEKAKAEAEEKAKAEAEEKAKVKPVATATAAAKPVRTVAKTK